jgi:hypothetical protein
MMHSRSESPRETPRGQLNLYEDSVEGATGHSPAIGTSSPIARTPSLSSRGLDSPVASPDKLTTLGGGVSAPDSTASPSRGVSSGDPKESEILGMANGSDEMLMTLLAGQAAMDCENLPIKGWEEVDGWKKVGLLFYLLSVVLSRSGIVGLVGAPHVFGISTSTRSQDCYRCEDFAETQYWKQTVRCL